jgi:hypothetical protein
MVCALCVGILFSGTATAQPGDHRVDMRAQVLDALFPLEVGPKPYFLKMVLRYGDSDTQFTVVIYPGANSEIIRYQLADMNRDELERVISKAIADNPRVKPQEIAAKLKVDVTRSPVNYETTLGPAIEELKSIRISPVLANRISVDDFSEYGFWYDTWQELVHYTIVSPFENEPQDELGKWMRRFRAKAEEWLKESSAGKR